MQRLMQRPSVLARYRQEVDAEMRVAFDGCSSPLYDMLRYHLGWQTADGRPSDGAAGKGLRSTLCLLACQALGGDRDKALPAAAALELVHNYSLIHDDIQDGDRERRHQPTVWAIWGEAQAINAGSAMRQLAGIALHRLVSRGVSPERTLRALSLVDETCLRLLEGQWLDISFEARAAVSPPEYLEMISLKTAALLGCAAELGALLAFEDQAAGPFKRFGRNLGLAFQIRDDALGIWGDGDETGKPAGSDIRRKKKSYPIIRALQESAAAAKELRQIYSREIDDAQVARVLELLDALGLREATQRAAERYRDDALVELAPLTLQPGARADLEELARFLVDRSH